MCLCLLPGEGHDRVHNIVIIRLERLDGLRLADTGLLDHKLDVVLVEVTSILIAIIVTSIVSLRGILDSLQTNRNR